MNAIERVLNYVKQREGRRSLDPEQIHALDVGCATEAVLTLSDLKELLALAEPPAPGDVDALLKALEDAAFAFGEHDGSSHDGSFEVGHPSCERCKKGRLNVEAKRALLLLAIRKEHDGRA